MQFVANPMSRSGTLAAANTSQELMPANGNRRGWFVQNLSANDLWVRVGAAATTAQPSIRIPANTMWQPDFVPTLAVNIIGATISTPFAAYEW